MLEKDYINHLRFQHLMSKAVEYDFCSFLRALRAWTGYSRHRVSEEIGISQSKLSRIESGNFKRYLPEHELIMFARYYNVEYFLLRKKMTKFIDEKMSNLQKK